MKDVARQQKRNLQAGLIVYLKPGDRQRLHEALRAEGIYSASSWFRQMAMAKLKTVGLGQDVESGHEA
jgi:hypothetical protein